MRTPPGCISPLAVLAVLATALLVGLGAARGGELFSPGELNAMAGTPLGEVDSHAALAGDCSACHPSPWDAAGLPGRCMACHTEIDAEMCSASGLHGILLEPGEDQSCQRCHTEHNGPEASLTLASLEDLRHERTGFPLDGGHAEIECAECHTGTRYAQVERTCAGCHAEPDFHAGLFPADCQSCHQTAAWVPASFPLQHPPFPVDHEDASTCRDCHPAALTAYSCDSCHEPAEMVDEHRDEGITDIRDCAGCHPTGEKDEARDRS